MKIRYELTELIDNDEYASLWLSNLQLNDKLQKQRFVVKSLNDKQSHSNMLDQIFHESATAFLHLKHNVLNSLFDFGLMSGRFFITQQYVEGFSLRQILKAASGKNVHLPLWFTLPILFSSIQAVKVIHESNRILNPQNPKAVNRISPSKIIVTATGLVKLIESGIFSQIQYNTEHPEKMVYQAPEVLNSESVDLRADVYSFGAVFYECVTGISLSENSDPVKFASGCSWIPKEVLVIIERTLNQNSNLRYSNLDELCRAVVNVIKKYNQTVTHIDLVNLLIILFPESAALSPVKEQIHQWLGNIEKTDEKKISWINAFSRACLNSSSTDAVSIDNPMMHFSIVHEPETFPETKTTLSSLTNKSSVQKDTNPDISLKPPDSAIDSAASFLRDERMSVQSQISQMTEIKNEDTFYAAAESEDADKSTDMWLTNKTLRYSRMKKPDDAGLPVGQSQKIIPDTTESDIPFDVCNNAAEAVSVVNSVNSPGRDAFELALAALKLKDYKLALELFHDASAKEPDNKIYTVNIKKIEKIMHKTN